MDAKSDHIPLYEKWTQLELTEDQDDLMLIFQKIIEMVQGIMHNRMTRKRPQTKSKPRGIPSSKVGSNQPGLNHEDTGTQPGSDSKLHMTTSVTQPEKTTNVSEKSPDQSAVDLNRDVETSGHDVSIVNSENKEGNRPHTIHDAQLNSLVSGLAQTHIERCQSLSDLEDEENSENVIHLDAELNAESSTDDLTLHKKKFSSDRNGNVVHLDMSGSQEVDTSGATAEQGLDEDCIDGPLAVQFVGHRPRSQHVSNMEVKKVKRKLSRALRFQVQPKVVKGDVSKFKIYSYNR